MMPAVMDAEEEATRSPSDGRKRKRPAVPSRKAIPLCIHGIAQGTFQKMRQTVTLGTVGHVEILKAETSLKRL